MKANSPNRLCDACAEAARLRNCCPPARGLPLDVWRLGRELLGQEENYNAFIIGLERTVYTLFGSRTDLTYDVRRDSFPGVGFTYSF